MTTLLVADVGGTGSRLACMTGGEVVAAPVDYLNSQYATFDAVLEDYLARLQSRPEQMAIAAAGPVSNQQVQMTNLGWMLSATDLAARHAIDRVEIMNDFAALAWATLRLGESDLWQVGGSAAQPAANRAILGPGTGLGVSSLIYTGRDWAVAAGEGGHVSLPAVTAEEQNLIAAVVEDYGHCSAERLLSGPGLARIFAACGGTVAAPERVTELAHAGDATALHAVDLFSTLLGTVASNLALTVGARGGVYLAGGILPAITELFAASGFRARFESKGRFNEYLQAIPVFIIRARYPSFVGLDGYMSSNVD